MPLRGATRPMADKVNCSSRTFSSDDLISAGARRAGEGRVSRISAVLNA